MRRWQQLYRIVLLGMIVFTGLRAAGSPALSAVAAARPPLERLAAAEAMLVWSRQWWVERGGSARPAGVAEGPSSAVVSAESLQIPWSQWPSGTLSSSRYGGVITPRAADDPQVNPLAQATDNGPLHTEPYVGSGMIAGYLQEATLEYATGAAASATWLGAYFGSASQAAERVDLTVQQLRSEGWKPASCGLPHQPRCSAFIITQTKGGVVFLCLYSIWQVDNGVGELELCGEETAVRSSVQAFLTTFLNLWQAANSTLVQAATTPTPSSSSFSLLAVRVEPGHAPAAGTLNQPAVTQVLAGQAVQLAIYVHAALPVGSALYLEFQVYQAGQLVLDRSRHVHITVTGDQTLRSFVTIAFQQPGRYHFVGWAALVLSAGGGQVVSYSRGQYFTVLPTAGAGASGTTLAFTILAVRVEPGDAKPDWHLHHPPLHTVHLGQRVRLSIYVRAPQAERPVYITNTVTRGGKVVARYHWRGHLFAGLTWLSDRFTPRQVGLYHYVGKVALVVSGGREVEQGASWFRVIP
jgi:hypothetical protein